MAFINSLNLINKLKFLVSTKIRNVYLTSSLYNNKISKIENLNLVYRPNPYTFDCLVKFNKKKKNIDIYKTKNIWDSYNLNYKEYKNLNNFFWLFSIDLKSSTKITQSIIEDWINKNQDYNSKSWELDILSKRIISWISNSKLTYEDGSEEYKKKFNFFVRKQVNHLKNEINRSELVDDKLIGCTAIILSGISYQDNTYLTYGLNLLNKFINYSLNSEGFPKSRSFRQLAFYLKYLVLIRELLKDSQNEIPEYLDETIYYLGQAYKLFLHGTKKTLLFNGNNEMENSEFDEYLKIHDYKFNCKKNEIAGYIYLKNNKNLLVVDAGNPPGKKFSQNYQSGTLSFEFFYLDNKIITNSGYFQRNKHQLNIVSRSSVAHSTLIIDNSSISKFSRDKFGKEYTDSTFKVFDKKISYNKYFWIIEVSHDGYLKNYGVIHNRKLEFSTENFCLKGTDTLIKKKNFKTSDFEIRFHLAPGAKLIKTTDGKSILIEFENSGWKFSCNENLIDYETGLYFGRKNNYVENNNFFVKGVTNPENQRICWEITKI